MKDFIVNWNMKVLITITISLSATAVGVLNTWIAPLMHMKMKEEDVTENAN